MKLKNKLTLILILVLNISIFAQDGYLLSGTVKGADNIPIPGVNVIISNSSRGASTDFDGLFQLDVQNGEVVEFSAMGFVSQSITITGQNNIDVVMIEDASQLDEVVVVGYGSMKKGDLTGAIGTLDSDEISKVASTNLGQSIQGKVAGVRVQQGTGQPGSGVSVKIRGTGSVLSGNEPLVLINGFQGSLDDIDADNVESMTILKDASAASIYGSRAANGVILVTTKKGKEGQMEVTFKVEAGVQQASRTIDYLNATDWANRQNEGRVNTGKAPHWTSDTVLPENLTNTDWTDFTFRKAPAVKTHLGINGGTENTKYSLGVGYIQQQGILIGTSFDRYNIRLDVEQKIGKFVVVGANLSANRSNYKSSLENYNNSGSAALNLISGGPASLPPYTNGTPTPPRYPGEMFAIERNISNAVASNLQNNVDNINATVANVFAQVQILPGFKYKLALNALVNNEYNKVFTNYYELYDAFDPTEVAVQSSPANLVLGNEHREFWEIQNIFTYNKSWGDHNFTALLGFSAQENTITTTSSEGSGFPNNDIQSLSAAENIIGIDSGTNTLSLASQFARINYNYENTYYFQGNVRRDGTSVFAPGNNYATFPSFSVGWKLSNENFLEDSNTISNLKVRYGYGSLGNAQIPPFAWISTVTVNETTALGESQNTVPGYSIKDLANEDVQWETTTTSNFGVDLSMLDNRLSFTGDVYSKKTTDMLLLVPVAPSSGFVNGPVANLGEVSNKGWEVMVNYNDTFGDWNVGASFNVSKNTNEVVDLGSTSSYTDGPLRIEEGRPIFAYWGYKTDGIWQSTDEIAANTSRGNARPGEVRYQDINGFDSDGNLTGSPDGVINDADKTEIGSNIPDFLYGFNFNVEYKGFDLSVLFQGESGKDMAIAPIFGGLGGGLDAEKMVNNNVPRYYYDNRTILGSDGNVSTPGSVPAVGRTPLRGDWSEFNIQDISYLRIKNIQLGYNLSSENSKKIGMKSFRVYLSMTNPVLWTNYIGYDPEFQGLDDGSNLVSAGGNGALASSGGVDAYPQAKATTLGIKCSF